MTDRQQPADQPPTAPAPRCSDAARERGDAMVGTAPPARRWLLLEQPKGWALNAWGRDLATALERFGNFLAGYRQ
ncbi:hypothetical protein [Ornithinicoccus halotolerans]|uniref:hypothetical protein n=1 Tax=Ornithinicoccus halotolerans TaxID=1748220 RepID=UPI00129545DE|nr:hypothetical protein [Ornithinicoccus halotolerans]